MLKPLVTCFGRGLLFLFPIVATILVIVWVFEAVGGIVGKPLENVFNKYVATALGLLITCSFIMLVGVLSSLFITQPIMQLIERLFARLPLVKLLYSSIRDVVGAFVGDKKKFDQPVLVNLMPGANANALGFITRKSLEFLGLEDHVAVYFPQSYNFAGSVLIVNRDHVKPVVDIDSSEIMAFIVSGGISGPS